MSESAKIIIDAEDLASKKFEQAAKAAEQNIKRVKDVGGKAKASTEFFGTLATSLGGSQLGSYAGQLAQLTERVSAFSEVSQAGKAGALAFKAGLAGLVAVASFKVGNALGDIVFQTGQWRRELEKATVAARELEQQALRASDKRVSFQLEDIELIRDPKEKQAAQEALFKRLENDIVGVTSQVKESQKAVDEWADAWQITSGRKNQAEEAAAVLAHDKARLDQLKQQRDSIRDMISERAQENEKLRERNALQDKSESFVQALRDGGALLKGKKEQLAAFTASKNTFGQEDRGEAERLLRERDMLQAKADAEKQAAEERERIAQQAETDAKRVADIRDREIASLRQQRIELEKGQAAAKAFALEQQGLDAGTARRLASEQARIDQLKQDRQERLAAFKEEQRTRENDQKQMAGKLANAQTGTTAVQSRLLTRGPAERGIDKIAKASEMSAKLLAKIETKLDQNKQRPIVLESVG